jgi:site-specific DNA recombinase
VENLDGSPESIIMESVLEGMAEYYSRNLAREVEKGKRENALKCKHIGGVPPLGYDVGDDRRYVVNEREAEAVRMIFQWVRDGMSYETVIDELNRCGYKSKRGNPFTKNTLYSILKNEKYHGLFTYNRSAPKDADGKRNGHKQKPREEWITVEGGVPAIVTKDIFDAVQAIMGKRMQTRTHSHAKETYLLTGKMVCGCCGGSYVGAKRRRGDKSIYAAYGCNKRYRAGTTVCTNGELSKAYVEGWIVERLSDYVFSDKYATKITDEYNRYIRSRNQSFNKRNSTYMARMKELNKDIDRTVSLLLQTTSNALTGKLQELEAEKAQTEYALAELERDNRQKEFTEAEIKAVLARIRELLNAGTLETLKTIVDKFISKVVVKPDGVIVHFNFFPDFTIKPEERTEKDCPVTERVPDAQRQSISCDTDPGKRVDDSGGEGETRTPLFAFCSFPQTPLTLYKSTLSPRLPIVSYHIFWGLFTVLVPK